MPTELASTIEAHVPAPPSERRVWLVALALGLLGAATLAAVLAGVIGGSGAAQQRVLPPALPVFAPIPTLAAWEAAGGRAGGAAARPAAIVARPSGAEQAADAARFLAAPSVHVSVRWMEGFYPIYASAQSTFSVNWLLLASIHAQESAFSTAPSTYRGLNFAHCCGGPMQFNVTNGPVTTWQLVSDSFRYGRRPLSYDHMTAKHPSIYDDFDSIMAAARLLSADGAEFALDAGAWGAAYDYYGHDATGVTYADQVLARAIGWSQHGFCINCGVDAAIVAAVHGAYGAPVLAALTAVPAPRRGGPRR